MGYLRNMLHIVRGSTFELDAVTARRLNPIQTALEYDIGAKNSGYLLY